MSAAQSLAEIARLLALASDELSDRAPLDDERRMTLLGLVIQAHTHAVIQGAAQKRAEIRAEFERAEAATPAHGTVQ